MKQKKNPDALRINRIRCILAIIVCTLLCVLVFLGVCIQLLDEPNPEIQEVGWKTYHLFTILSNMLMAASAAMCIPYAVDGLRNHNYHLPRRILNMMEKKYKSGLAAGELCRRYVSAYYREETGEDVYER